ncbi:Helicase-like, DEXD box c2 type [Corchorus olitorius]|uniref:DNA 5'-3' helicase FANCJ n=1 Tax=Corchorus olitorius TaxID=93759 RepID=A0A1R3KKH4_9ROSI|nr:Helicase-like, DEXD box c2 type [Corchorus olitorius]
MSVAADGANPTANPNPNIANSENPKNVYQIAGVPVQFPYKPYGTQFTFMYRVISTLDRAQKEGRCHALLESPTGTGKSLSLLCSTLAWQQNNKLKNLKNLQAHLSHSTPAPEAITDPLGHGGGFIPETQPSTRSMADGAQLVFCPYNYIINPVIRGAMDVDIKGAVIVLDEAHNIEDIARDAGSVDLEEDALLKLQTELQQIYQFDATIYQPLYEMTQDLIAWIEQRKSTLEEREFQHYFSSWTGDNALRQLQEANISQQCFPILLDCATKAIKASTDTESDEPHLSGMSVITLEGLFSSLTYFFSRNGSHIFDYQLALRRFKKDSKNAFGSWTCCLSLWCLNPAVVFRDIADLSLSVILTSGTLSPMNSFSSELGVQFGNCLEAPHVIDVKSQVWSAVISHSPGNYVLDASYKTSNTYAFQDALGKSLEEICKTVPGGSLIFFPSYKLMETLCKRWKGTGQWSRLNAIKRLFVEPRGGSQEEFETVLKGYYDSVSRGKKPALGRKRRIKRTDDNVIESTEVTNRKGAAFLGVFRGKVSEGIDFSDDNARVVIAVGIPFPNINDIQVALKKQYNNTYKSSKNLLSGSEWYCQQAFRALNQALGRCIRHKDDYGAIILLDWRYEEERNRAYISKWLKPAIKKFESFEKSLEELRSFFRDVKDLVGKNKQQLSLAKYDAIFSQMKAQSDLTVQTSVQVGTDRNTSKEYIDLECSSPKESRSFETLSTTFSNEDPDLIIVKETPPFGGSGISIASPSSVSKDVNSNSTIIHASTKSSDQFSIHPMSSTSLNEVPSTYESGKMFTPEKDVKQNASSLIPKIESPLNLSVCSYIQKRRKSVGSPFINLVIEECTDSPAKVPVSRSFKENLLANRDITRRMEFDFETGSAENNPKTPQSLATDGSLLLYVDCVEIRNSEAAGDEAAKDNVNSSSVDRTAVLSSIDKFAYSPKQPNLGGWRTTKSKVTQRNPLSS